MLEFGFWSGVEAMYGQDFSTSPFAGAWPGGSGATVVAGFGWYVTGGVVVAVTLCVTVVSMVETVGLSEAALVHAVRTMPAAAAMADGCFDSGRLVARGRRRA